MVSRSAISTPPPTRQLADLEHAFDASGTVTPRRSKTDQEGAGDVRSLAPDSRRALAAWIGAASLTDSRRSSSLRKGGCDSPAIGPGDVAHMFKRMEASAGIGARRNRPVQRLRAQRTITSRQAAAASAPNSAAARAARRARIESGTCRWAFARGRSISMIGSPAPCSAACSAQLSNAIRSA